MKTIKELEKDIKKRKFNLKNLEQLKPKDRKNNYLFIVGEEINKLDKLKAKLEQTKEICKMIKEWFMEDINYNLQINSGESIQKAEQLETRMNGLLNEIGGKE